MNYNLNELNSKDPKTKYATQKHILKLAETEPDKIYKDFDFFAELLSNNNNIMVWTGLLVLGNLAKVDKDNKIDNILPQIKFKLNTGKMITAGNAMRALINIALSKPAIADELALEILKSKAYKYDTVECSNVHIGHMFKCIELIWNILSRDVQEKFITFAKSQISNARSATSQKATLFLKKSVAVQEIKRKSKIV